MATMKYRYTGHIDPNDENRRAFLPGIPARDLTDDDLAQLTDEQRASVAENAAGGGAIYEEVKAKKGGDA